MKLIPLHKNQEHIEHTLGIAFHWLMQAEAFSEGPRIPKAKDVFNLNYQHGGGWSPLKGADNRYTLDTNTGVYTYPGDPPQHPVAKIEYGDEVLFAYDHAMWAIIQKDGTFEIARMD